MKIPKHLIEGGEELNKGYFFGEAVSEFTREELLGLVYFLRQEMEEYREISRRSYDND